MEVYFNRSLIVCHKILIARKGIKISKDNKAGRKFSPDTNSLDSRNEQITMFKFSFTGQLLESILIYSAYLVHLHSNRFLKSYSLRFFLPEIEMIFKICLESSISRYFRRIKIFAQNEPMTSVCNNKARLCTCKNSFVSICELDFDQANTATRPDSGRFRPCRFTRIRSCLKTERYFFRLGLPSTPRPKTLSWVTVELLKTPAYRFRADGLLKTEVMSLL